MKKVISILVFTFTAIWAFGLQHSWEASPACQFQFNTITAPVVIPESVIVINEIMYNNPGTDDYEFIELYNAGDLPIQMEGYRFTTGVTFTFPAYTLLPDSFVVVAIDSAKFRMAFNVPALQWNSGQAVNNTGELITLLDAAGAILDTVRYSASIAPWPTAANGGGPSLQLCDPGADNSNGNNWAASSNGTGFFVNGIEILATPGTANNCTPLPPPSYPIYPIGVVNTENADGVADSLNVRCQIQGTVYGINLRTTGLQFTVIDDVNEGIAVFSTTADFDYSVEEANEVIIRGRITQFNGLTQILPDTVILVSQFRPLIPATVVTELNEGTESKLVRIENLSIVDPAQWINTGAGFNVDVTNGSSTFQMRIVSTSNIFGTTAPTGTFNLTGLGGQFDSSSPYTEGYQIFPRYLADINLISSSSIVAARKEEIVLSPNPGRGSVQITSQLPFEAIRVTDRNGRTVFFNWFSPQTQMQLDISTLTAGAYQVAVISGKKIQTVQMVVQ